MTQILLTLKVQHVYSVLSTSSVSAGLCNITGGPVLYSEIAYGAVSGAFIANNTGGSAAAQFPNGYRTYPTDSANFNASSSNSIYGNSDTVTPESLSCLICIKYE